MKHLTIFLAALCIAGGALAVEPKEMLKDPALEARARQISKQLRCVQCQNESIDESNAQIARDMRILVRDRLTAGDSDQQIVDYMVSRYGDYVLLMPRFAASTLVLWLGPLAILILGGVIVSARLRRAGAQPGAPLSPEEEIQLSALTNDIPRDSSGDKS
jgi:cytochrome c-type biogenesis protein CcmH